MRTILIAAIAAALLQDPPPVPMGGRVAWGKDPAAAEKRARLEQRALVLYFTDGGMPCKALDAGAFSADDVVAATRRMFPVMFECADDKAHADWRARLKVIGFPTVAVLEPDGKTHFEISAREPDEMASELNRAAGRFPGRDVLWSSTMEAAVEKTKEERRPIAIYFHAAEDDLGAAQDRVAKLAGASLLNKFIWLELTATMDEKDPLKKKYDYYSLPAIAFVDPRFPEPKWMTTFELSAKAKPKDVQERLEKALKKYKDTKIK